jgi:TolB protein
MTRDPLSSSLGELAESVRDADLYERSLRRSRSIGRRRAAAVAGAGLAVLGLAGAGLLFRPGVSELPPPVVSPTRQAPSSPAPSTSAAPSAPPSAPPSPARATVAVPQSRSLGDLPGRVFYRSADRVTRLDPDGAVRTVLDTPHDAVAVSPSGGRIAYVTDGRLRLAGSFPEPVLDGTVDPGRLPAWSPDGERLIVAAPEPGVLTVATGAFTPLPASLGGQHFRWSADGRRLVYGTSSCRLKVAAAGARSGTTVPVIGDPEAARNPDGTAACRPLSADRTGARITAPLESAGSEPGADLVPADALVDTRTGDVLPLPVSGRVTGLLFGPDGNLLIRTTDGGGAQTLSVLAPDGTLLVRAREPAAVGNAELLAYTR